MQLTCAWCPNHHLSCSLTAGPSALQQEQSPGSSLLRAPGGTAGRMPGGTRESSTSSRGSSHGGCSGTLYLLPSFEMGCVRQIQDLEKTVAKQIQKTRRLQISCAYGYNGAVERLGGQKNA